MDAAHRTQMSGQECLLWFMVLERELWKFGFYGEGVDVAD